MLHCVVDILCSNVYVVMCSCMLCSVVICYQDITSCAVLLDVTKSYYMLCSVVTCYLELLHAVQYCYMCIVLLNFVQPCYML